MVQSMATGVQLIAGKRQSNRCGFAIKKEAKVEKMRLLKEKYKDVYVAKEEKRAQKERDDLEQIEAYLEIRRENLRKKKLKKELGKEYRNRQIEKDIKKNQKRKDEKITENLNCIKP